MGKDIIRCHCQFLEPEFWHNSELTVLAGRGFSGLDAKFSSWLDSQKSLRNHLLFQTSGSTGKSKWVAISKSALIQSAKQVNHMLGVVDGARWALVLPFYHVGGFGVLTRAFLSGGHCAVYHGKWDAVNFSGFISKSKSEYVSLVPTQVVDLVRNRCIVPPSLKSVVVGGGRLSDSVYEQAKNLGWPILRSYGMTESASQIATGDVADSGLKVLDGWEIRINAQGLIEWKGEAGMTGYVTEDGGEYQVQNPYVDGWFSSNDLGEFDGEHLKVLGRADQSVKILGELVDLAALEQEVEAQCGRACVIFTEADERRGVTLHPVLEGGSKADLSGFTGLKTMQEARYVAQFPRSELGKIRRSALRDLLS